MFRRWRKRRPGGSVTRPPDVPGAAAVVEEAMRCATRLQVLGDQIDAFRRRGEAAIGGQTGPEVDVLREQQNEILDAFLERTLQVKADALDDARRRLAEMYHDTRGDLVTGRALELVEAALRRQP